VRRLAAVADAISQQQQFNETIDRALGEPSRGVARLDAIRMGDKRCIPPAGRYPPAGVPPSHGDIGSARCEYSTVIPDSPGYADNAGYVVFGHSGTASASLK
jgi:hypothetical protein